MLQEFALDCELSFSFFGTNFVFVFVLFFFFVLGYKLLYLVAENVVKRYDPLIRV